MRLSTVRRATTAGVAAAVLSTAFVPPAVADEATWTVRGPGSDLTAVVRLSDGAPELEVSRNGATILPASDIGIVTADADLTDDLRFTGRSDRTVVENYRTTTGKQRRRHSVMQESTLSFTGPQGTQLDVVVRVSDDAVAYRYRLPAGAAVLREASSWELPADASAWLLNHSSWYESPRFETTAGEAGTGNFGYPALFQVDESYVLLTESGMTSAYPGSMLRHEHGSGTYQVGLV